MPNLNSVNLGWKVFSTRKFYMNQQQVFACYKRRQECNCYSASTLSPPPQTEVVPQDLQLSYIYKLGNKRFFTVFNLQVTSCWNMLFVRSLRLVCFVDWHSTPFLSSVSLVFTNQSLARMNRKRGFFTSLIQSIFF